MLEHLQLHLACCFTSCVKFKLSFLCATSCGHYIFISRVHFGAYFFSSSIFSCSCFSVNSFALLFFRLFVGPVSNLSCTFYLHFLVEAFFARSFHSLRRSLRSKDVTSFVRSFFLSKTSKTATKKFCIFEAFLHCECSKPRQFVPKRAKTSVFLARAISFFTHDLTFYVHFVHFECFGRRRRLTSFVS